MHAKQIVHRDLKPQNLMLVENDVLNPLRIIDMGSALLTGQPRNQRPVMDDFTEIYAPPEAPVPDEERADAYDIYTVAIIALRSLMPALLAGEAGVQTLGKVTCVELPAYEYNFTKWCESRANNRAAASQEMPLNSECAALMQLPEFYALLGDMLQVDAAQRPDAQECLARLGPEWSSRYQRRASENEREEGERKRGRNGFMEKESERGGRWGGAEGRSRACRD